MASVRLMSCPPGHAKAKAAIGSRMEVGAAVGVSFPWLCVRGSLMGQFVQFALHAPPGENC